MSNDSLRSEFNRAYSIITSNLDELSATLAVARNDARESLITDDKVSQRVSESYRLASNINRAFGDIVSCFNRAYASLQSHIDTSINDVHDSVRIIGDNIEEVRTKLLISTDAIHAMNRVVSIHDSILDDIAERVEAIMRFVTYQNPSNDYTTKARFMISNVKMDDGQPIKGKTLNVSLLATILMRYDEMREHQQFVNSQDRHVDIDLRKRSRRT